MGEGEKEKGKKGKRGPTYLSHKKDLFSPRTGKEREKKQKKKKKQAISNRERNGRNLFSLWFRKKGKKKGGRWGKKNLSRSLFGIERRGCLKKSGERRGKKRGTSERKKGKIATQRTFNH